MKRGTLVVLLIIILFWSCERESILDPIPKIDPISVVTVTTFVDSGVVIDPSGIRKVPSGTDLSYKYSIKSGYFLKSIEINQISHDFTDGVISIAPVVNTELKIKTEMLPTYYFLLEDTLYLRVIRIRQDGEIVDSFFYYKNANIVQRLVFKTNGNTFTTAKDGTMMQTSDWRFVDESHIIIGDQYYTILKIDKNNLIYSKGGFYNLKPATYEEVYFRP